MTPSRFPSHPDAGSAGRFGWTAPTLSAWLAVLAVLLQTVVPDFAMAARNTARLQTMVLPDGLGGHQAGYCRAGPVGAEPAQPPANQHPHEELCAFCLALNTHATPDGGTPRLTVPTRYAAMAPFAPPGISPPQLFRFNSRPRAPPTALSV